MATTLQPSQRKTSTPVAPVPAHQTCTDVSTIDLARTPVTREVSMRKPTLREGLAFGTLLVMACMSVGYIWSMLLPPLTAFLFSVVSGGVIGFTVARMLIKRLRTPLPPSQDSL